MAENTKSNKVARAFTGTVVSTKAAKTIVVRVDVMKLHSKYHKQFRASRKYHAHDEKGAAKVGDTVKIVACRPMSALKHWRLAGIIKKGE